MSLGDCLVKAGKAFDKAERDELLARVNEIVNTSDLTGYEAEVRAVQERIEASEKERARILADAESQSVKSSKKPAQPTAAAPTADQIAERQKVNDEVTAELRANKLTARALDNGLLQVVHSEEMKDVIDDKSWEPIYAETGDDVSLGAFNPTTGEAVVFSDRVAGKGDAVPVGVHELLHAAQDYARRKGVDRFGFLLGDARATLHRRLELLRKFGNARERAILQKAHDAFTAAGVNNTSELNQQLEWVAYAIQAIVKAKAESRTLSEWLGDVRLAVLDTIRKVLGIKVTPDNLSMSEFAKLTELAIGEVNAEHDRHEEHARMNGGGDVLSSKSPAFKKWFGDSKVVDDNGDPLIVYHGAPEGFTEFERRRVGSRDHGFFGSGFYFTPDYNTAQEYADSAAEADRSPIEGSIVIPTYVSLQQPFVWDMSDEGAESTRTALASFGVKRNSVRGDMAALSHDEERRKFMRGVRAAGHDGVIVRDEEGMREIVAFDPTQIKSATNNSGAFDATNPNIMSSKAQARLKGMPETENVPGRGAVAFGNFKPAVDAAKKYAKEAGIDYNPPKEFAPIDPVRATKIANEFELMEHAPDDPEVQAAYEAMVDETLAQYNAVLATGLKVEFIKGPDPYASPREAILDAINNNHLYVFSTREGFGSDANFDPTDNPLLAKTNYRDINGTPMLVNDVFRVVHDYFGHIKNGVGFRARGEENAWQSHAAMYSPLARRAMTTETRGQNSWVNYGPYAAHNKVASPADTRYADQKIGLLPIWVSEESRLSERQRRSDGVYTRGLEGAIKNGRLQLSHFSREAITRTEPHRAGTGADRRVSGRRYLPEATYFGIVAAAKDGYRIENDAGVSGVESKFSIEPTALYPANANPEKLWRSGDLRASIEAMKAAGFSGYWANDKQLGKVAVVWDPLQSDSNVSNILSSKAPKQNTAFQKWFGDSKVVDKNGDPKVVYHGTDQMFDSFGTDKLGSNTRAPSAQMGFFFASRKRTAKYYSRGEWPNVETARKRGSSPTVMPVFLRIENPYIYDMKNRVFRDRTFASVIQQAKDAGHDGVILERAYDAGEYGRFHALMNGTPFGESLYVVFDPSQIKSATGNDGSFDANDNSILSSKGPRGSKQWHPVADFEGMPQLVNADTAMIPVKELRASYLEDTDSDIQDHEAMHLGHDIADGNRVFTYMILNDAGKIVGDAMLELNQDNEVEALHDINTRPAFRGQGIAEKAVSAILANTDKPIRIVQVLRDAESFWQKMGVQDLDHNKNGTLTWGDYAAERLTPRASATSDSGVRVDAGAQSQSRQAGVDDGQPGAVHEVDESDYEGDIADFAKILSSSQPRITSPITPNELGVMERVASRYPKILGILSRNHIAEVAPRTMTAVRDFVNAAERMDADRNLLLSAAGDLLNRWHRWARSTRENKAMAVTLHKLMHSATVVGYDPAEAYKPLITETEYLREQSRLRKKLAGATTAEERLSVADLMKQLDVTRAEEQVRKRAQPDLDRRWASLSDTAKDFYREVRDQYKKERDSMYRELKKRMERMEMSDNVRRQMAEKLRMAFESNTVRGPYFPLSRFGEFWVVVKDRATGETEAFHMFDSESDQKAFAKEQKARGFDVRSGTKSEEQGEWQHVDPQYAATVAGLIGDATDVDRKARFELADQVWQLYLQTLPEMSVRKQHIHRKKTKGWNEDAMRGYAKLALHHAHHITKIRHGDQLATHVNRAKVQAAELEDSSYADRIVDYLTSAQDWAMNPTSSPLASFLTSLGFAWYLSVSPAAALVNMFQTPMVGIPYLGARFGFDKASRELWAASSEFSGVVAANTARRGKNKQLFLDNDQKLHWGERLQGDEKKAYDSFVQAGRFEKTLAHDTAGIADQGMERGASMALWMERLAASFHNAEVFNREVTAMAAYRLGRKSGLSHDAAFAYADNAVTDIHFNYSNAARAPAIRKPAMKVIGQFKQYALNMSFRILRDAYVATLAPNIPPAERKEIRRRALGMVAMSWLFGGVSGFAGYSAIKAVANLVEDLFGDDDDPWDFETDVRTGLKHIFKDMLGDTDAADSGAESIADFLWKGPTDFLTGAAIGTRVAPDVWKMWIQEDSQGYEGRAGWANVITQAMGPVVGGLMGMFADGIQKAGEGEYRKAAEQMAPKFVRDISKMFRFAEEGVTNLRGDPILGKDDVSGWELALQGVGFTPAELEKQFAINRASKAREKEIDDRRTKLMGRAALEAGAGEVSQDTIDAIIRFNEKNPEVAISGKSISSSTKGRLRASATSMQGVTINPRLREKINREVDY